MSQEELAQEVKVTRNQIANVEAMRVPLKAGLAMALYKQLLVNPSWLARGVGVAIFADQSWCRLITGHFEPDLLFSRFFAESLSPIFDRIDRLVSRFSNQAEWWEKEGKRALNSLPKSPENLRIVRKMGEELQAVMKMMDRTKNIEARIKASVTKTSGLTETAKASKTERVKELFPKLRARLNEATASPGKKSELAEFLGAPLASVSRWLSGDREPGGEIALKMLYWVEQQERK